MEQAVIVHETQAPAITAPMAIEEIVGQVNLIQSVMSRVMKEEEHFGVIPGTGNKPSLLKSGAEKLAMTFRMAPKYDIQAIDMGSDHREYEINCHLHTIQTGVFLGSGVGNCNTKESKYRYRSENTGKPVPQTYWETRDANLLGGSQFRAKKKDGKWVICEQVEHDNPADYYNTIKKMAKKRAFVDAVLTVTAASDIFTQDIEDLIGFDKKETQKITTTAAPATDQTNQQANYLVKLMDDAKTTKDLQKVYEGNVGLIASFSENLKERVYACYWTRKKRIEKQEATPPPAAPNPVSEPSAPQDAEDAPPPSNDDPSPPVEPGNHAKDETTIEDAHQFMQGFKTLEGLDAGYTELSAQLTKSSQEVKDKISVVYEELKASLGSSE